MAMFSAWRAARRQRAEEKRRLDEIEATFTVPGRARLTAVAIDLFIIWSLLLAILWQGFRRHPMVETAVDPEATEALAPFVQALLEAIIELTFGLTLGAMLEGAVAFIFGGGPVLLLYGLISTFLLLYAFVAYLVLLLLAPLWPYRAIFYLSPLRASIGIAVVGGVVVNNRIKRVGLLQALGRDGWTMLAGVLWAPVVLVILGELFGRARALSGEFLFDSLTNTFMLRRELLHGVSWPSAEKFPNCLSALHNPPNGQLVP